MMRREPRIVAALAGVLCTSVWGWGCKHGAAEVSGQTRLESVPFAWGTGGTLERNLRISPEQWELVKSEFEPPARDGAAERRAIRGAVHRLQVIACEQTPVGHAVGFSKVDSAGEGRMDCVDCSTATMRFIGLLQERGLLRRHRLMEAAWRYLGGVVPVHRTAVIEETATGAMWAVDPWLGPYREAPKVIELARWKAFDDREDEGVAATGPAPSDGTGARTTGRATIAP